MSFWTPTLHLSASRQENPLVTAVEFQPSGEVTLIFSGTSRVRRSCWRNSGTDAYREALAEHRRIVREAYARYSGYEVDYEGDAFFEMFASAPDAVCAVSEAMAGLEAGPISIRVGIHTGHPRLDPPKYVGMDVHTAARIMSSGHGGQVAVSPTTAALVDVSLAETLASTGSRTSPRRSPSSSSVTAPSLRSRRSRTRTCPVLRAPS